MELGPTELTPAGAGPNLELAKDRLWVRYTGDGRHDVGAIQVRTCSDVGQWGWM